MFKVPPLIIYKILKPTLNVVNHLSTDNTLISLKTEVENLVRIVAEKNKVSPATVRNTATLLGLQIYITLKKQPNKQDYTHLIDSLKKIMGNGFER